MGEISLRFDAGRFITPPIEDRDGYLRVDATICVPGILTYVRPDGSIVKEFRSPEQNRVLVETLNGRLPIPVTIEHPPSLLNVGNAGEFMVGTGDRHRFDGATGDAISSLVYYSQDAKKLILDGSKREVSLGYRCRTLKDSGTWKGERYDAVQLEIDPNHIATTARARAGPNARLHLDARLDSAIDIAFAAERTDADTDNKNRRYFIMGDGNRYDGDGLIPYQVQRGERVLTYRVNRDALDLLERNQDALDEYEDRLDGLTREIEDYRSRLDDANELKNGLEASNKRWKECYDSLKNRVETAEAILAQDNIYYNDSDGSYYAYVADGRAKGEMEEEPDGEEYEEEEMEMEGEPEDGSDKKHHHGAKKTKKDSLDLEFPTIADLFAVAREFPSLSERLDRETPRTRGELRAMMASEARAAIKELNPSFRCDGLDSDTILEIYAYERSKKRDDSRSSGSSRSRASYNFEAILNREIDGARGDTGYDDPVDPIVEYGDRIANAYKTNDGRYTR